MDGRYRIITESSELEHHGILGQKWGIRRFQNPDGSLTPEGKRRYDAGDIKKIDTHKYIAYDKKVNANKYGRLSEEQKQSNNFKKAVEIQKALDEEGTRFYSDTNQKEWKKYAKEYAAERYDKHIKQGKNIDESKEDFIDRWVKDARGSGDMSLSVWEYYADKNPKIKKLNDEFDDWLQTTIKKEAANGVNLNYGEVYRQVMDAYFNNELEHSDEDDPNKYGLPSLKKYPMPDAKHVRSAIKFFNYVEPKYEKELANAILNRMQEYGMSFDNFTVGEDNRFSKYMPKNDELEHHGILGQKWGIRRFQNADGSLTPTGRSRYSSDSYQGKDKWHKANKESAADFDGDRYKYVGPPGQQWRIDKKKLEEREAKRQTKKDTRAEALRKMREEEDRIAAEEAQRKKEYKERQRLIKTDPKYLSDAELRMLNDRKNAENQFNKNYHPESFAVKKGKEYAIQAADSLIRQVVIPSLVATGKSKVHQYVKDAVKSGDLPEVYADIIEKEFSVGKKKGSPDGGGKKRQFTRK